MTLSDQRFITIKEMALRDGLQNEILPVSIAQKLNLIDLLVKAGVKTIEVGSFVSPRLVPQMADTDKVFAQINADKGVVYSALVPNLQGYQRAKSVHVKEIAVFVAASESFSKHNTNCSIADAMERIQQITNAAAHDKIPVRAYISCVALCPYEGAVDPLTVVDLSKALLNLGCYEISLGETTGKADQDKVDALLKLITQSINPKFLAGHFHDTNGQALRFIRMALDYGIRIFDASAGGLGGCPFAPGAKGNVASEEVVAMLAEKGFDTGIDLELLRQAGAYAQSLKSPARPDLK